MPDSSLSDAKVRMRKALNALAHEFTTVRTGRASAAVLDGIRVDYYGTPTPIGQMAAIKSPEASMLIIEPWDKSALGLIEKAIQASDLGLNPSNDGTLIRLPFPQLNEERRRELVKQVKHYAEDGKVAVRNVRRDVIEHLKKQEKSSEITQDDLHRAEGEVQKLTDAHTHEIDEMVKTKETEIMEV